MSNVSLAKPSQLKIFAPAGRFASDTFDNQSNKSAAKNNNPAKPHIRFGGFKWLSYGAFNN
jgi:hypothetical protein